MSLYLCDKKEKKDDHIRSKCCLLASLIESKYEALTEILLKYESFETVNDEIHRSIDCLTNISKELEWLLYGKVDLICTFLPINLPLYSLVIFGIVPSFMTNEVVIRPPLLVKGIVQEIWQLLGFEEIIQNIKFVDVERSLFNEAFVSIADVILFSGRFENAKNVQNLCPDALFIYNGAGVNPIIITSSANLSLALDKTVEARIFNSGQDCHGPDIIFVHEKIIDDFEQKLVTKLERIKVGDYQDRCVSVGHLIDVDLLSVAHSFIDAHAKSIVYGGKINFKEGIVFPTIIREDIQSLSTFKITEFFSPIFYLLVYHEDNDLRRFFSQRSYIDFAMYTSIFGDTSYSTEIPNTVILQDKILNDVERGNDPFGGYGPKSNYVSHDGVFLHRPILISYEVYAYLQERIIFNK